MKQALFCCALICFGAIGYAQTEKRVSSDIDAVTVFLNQAQIERSAKARIGAGRTTVVFEGLSPKIDPNSLQVSGKGAALILNAKHAFNYLNKNKYEGKAKTYADSIEVYERQKVDVQDQIEILVKEEGMLLQNQSIGGANAGLQVEELRKMTVFFRERLTEIRLKRRDLARDVERIQTRINDLQGQLGEIYIERNQRSGEIRITLEAKAATTVELAIKYLVNGASWTPTYDLRAEDTDSPLQLYYKANVQQRTGVDWKNVKLTLSTIDPTVGGDKPELYTEYVRIYQPVARRRQKAEADYGGGFGAAGGGDDGWGDDEVLNEVVEVAEAPAMATMAQRTVSAETMLAAEFRIDTPYDVPSDGKPQLVDVQTNELEARYQHFAVPKMDEDAFLVAYVGDWEQYNLFSGEMNIYFAGTFVGQSFLDTENLADTLEFSLGRDQNVVIERKQLQDRDSKPAIGSNKRETKRFQIKVRNTKEQTVRILIEDHIPVSEDSRIEVELLTHTPKNAITKTVEDAKKNDGFGAANDGKLQWEFVLKPSEEKTLEFSYEIKYPKSESLSFERRN